MSYKFSKKSLERLATCHKDLQDICNELIQIMDVTIVCGHRGEQEQDNAFNRGRSKLKWPNSKHNKTPSLAVDIAPYKAEIKGIDWTDTKSFYEMLRLVEEIADDLKIKIRLGRDFSFSDLPHVELVIKEKNKT